MNFGDLTTSMSPASSFSATAADFKKDGISEFMRRLSEHNSAAMQQAAAGGGRLPSA